MIVAKLSECASTLRADNKGSKTNHNVAITLRVMYHPDHHSKNDAYNVVITLRVMHHSLIIRRMVPTNAY